MDGKIKRGEVYYIKRVDTEVGSEQKSGRPGIIVSNDKNNTFSSTVEVVYMTTQPKSDLPTHVQIRSAPTLSIALCEQITTVSKTRMGDYYSVLTDEEMRMVEIAMALSLGIDLCIEPNEVSSSNSPEEKSKSKYSSDVTMSVINQTLEKQNRSLKAECLKLRTSLDIYENHYKDLLNLAEKFC